MEQKKLIRTLDSIASRRFKNENEMLIEVLDQIVVREQIKVTGGRIWRLNKLLKAYELVYQTGDVHKIPNDFKLPLNEYPIFKEITKERTVLASETNKFLISKGIFRYSASGVGLKIKVDDDRYYEYLLVVNSDEIDDDLGYTLNIVATILTAKLNAWRASVSRKDLIEDIDRAKQLQKSILPEHEYSFHNYDLFGITVPAKIIGGDFFDYLEIGPQGDRLGIVVGDAASKGLAAAAEAMYISGALRMASTFEIKISPLFYRMNELVNKIFEDDKFASLFYCEISTDKKGLCLYANAGHNPPIFYDKSKDELILLHPTGPLIGPAPHSAYDTDSFNFSPGDILVIFTDGITEAANEKFEFYDESRLEELIRKNVSKTPKEIALSIIESVSKFSTSDSKYQDDKTIVVIKRKG
ncbi:serine phosphatase rsbu, regulator of sigma subunit [hydrocarbon metagenome]|uniref:Serine phosphatase rsbu, regulator of sigma subunit n=1 Tax=hydrocarbon metagenome TaxID=938273 RepID=A0A0W8FY27_9ZZZZ